jgi:beta-lactam-binding protein with PASTA domain
MKRFARLLLLALVLIFAALASMLTAMRFAIHGREVAVPGVAGMEPEEARSKLNDLGLVMKVEDRFYSAEIPAGRLVSQLPPAGSKLRKGALVRVAESLGKQQMQAPDVVGESARAAAINIQRRGLEVGNTAVIHLPNVVPDTVIAQDPPANSGAMETPKVSLLISASDSAESYVMPEFVGHHLADVVAEVQRNGFSLSKATQQIAGKNSAAVIVKQLPAAGQKMTKDTEITFEIAR